MAETIVLQMELTCPDDPQEWEVHFYRLACAWAREAVEAYLRQMDDVLLKAKPAGWRVVGKRRRKGVTRFGEVTLERRLYRDGEGKGRFLLDEVLGLMPRQVATPAVHEGVVALAADVSFGKAAAHLSHLTAGVLSKSTVWRLVQRTGHRAGAMDEEATQRVYEEGEELRMGERRPEVLYVEGDGAWVPLQRQEEKGLEIKVGMAYEGWECVSAGEEKRYRLRHKRVYVHSSPRFSFWEGATVAWGRVWDWRAVQWVVLNGDDAAWIDQGKDMWERVVRQQDGFHVARACRRALGKEPGRALYQALRQGDREQVSALWQQAQPRPGKQARRVWAWLRRQVENPDVVDWRQRIPHAPPQGRGLGCMEGNIAHIIAKRMKNQGRSWSPQGALAMAKVQELMQHGELSRWCRRLSAPPSRVGKRRAPPRPHRLHQRGPGAWLQAHIPALQGRIPSHPALLRLRSHLHLLN